jgi:hypothetical protein
MIINSCVKKSQKAKRTISFMATRIYTWFILIKCFLTYIIMKVYQNLLEFKTISSNIYYATFSFADQNQNKKTSLKNKRVRTIFTPEQLERLGNNK